jgi:hypothetical protein
MDGEQAATVDRRTRVSRARWLVLAAAVAVAALVLAIATRPTSVEGTGTLSECHWGYPIVSIDGGDPYLPIAVWPEGLRYDYEVKAVVDGSGQPVIRLGERIALKGTIVEVHGDPSPCYYTRNISLTSIKSVP